MNNRVTKRFVEVHNRLLETKKVRSSRQFAISLDYIPQSLSEILKGRRDASVLLIQKLIEVYDVNPQYLFCDADEMFKRDNLGLAINKLNIAVDEDNQERIVYVPVAAQAGYGHQFHDDVYCSDLETFTLPDDRFRYGTHRCFDVAGDSMEPTLYAQDKVVCSFIEPENWTKSIRDNLVYIVVTENDVFVKRVKNRIKQDQCLQLISDNEYYRVKELPITELKEIWCVRVKISPFMPSPGNVRNAFQNQVDELRETVKGQSDLIRGLNHTIEKLLKQNRLAVV